MFPLTPLSSFLRIHVTSVNTPAFDSTQRRVHVFISSDARRKCTPAQLLHTHFFLIFSLPLVPVTSAFLIFCILKSPSPPSSSSLLHLVTINKRKFTTNTSNNQASQQGQALLLPPSLWSCNRQSDCFYMETSGSLVSFRRRRSATLGQDASTSTHVIFRRRLKKIHSFAAGQGHSASLGRGGGHWVAQSFIEKPRR